MQEEIKRLVKYWMRKKIYSEEDLEEFIMTSSSLQEILKKTDSERFINELMNALSKGEGSQDRLIFAIYQIFSKEQAQINQKVVKKIANKPKLARLAPQKKQVGLKNYADQQEESKKRSISIIANTRGQATLAKIKISPENYKIAFQNAINFIFQMVQEKVIIPADYDDDINNVLNFSMLTTPIPVSVCYCHYLKFVTQGGSEKTQLLPTDFKYYLLPSDIRVQAKGFTLESIRKKKGFQYIGIRSGELEQDNQEDFNSRMVRFQKFILHFAKIPYSKITIQQLKSASKKCSSKFIGVDGFLTSLRKNMIGFASCHRGTIPRGMLLYGPPGTGKSAISEFFLNNLSSVMLTPKLSPGDFNQGIKGDTERMMRGLQKRAKLIPWDVGFVIVDEIDSLVPNRQASSTTNDQKQSIGTLFPIMDKVESFVIVGTTNFKNSIDDAYNRRVTQNQYFLGVLNKIQRKEWPLIIAKKEKRTQDKIVDKFLKSSLLQRLSKWAINFTPSIYEILLQNFYDTIQQEKIQSEQNMKKVLIETVIMVSQNFSPKIEIRERPLVSYLLEENKICSEFLTFNNPNFYLQNEWEEESKSVIYYTGRIFFDLSSTFEEEKVQVQQVIQNQHIMLRPATIQRTIKRYEIAKILTWKDMDYFYKLDRTLMPKSSFPAQEEKERYLLEHLQGNFFELEKNFPSKSQRIQTFFQKWVSDWKDLISNSKSLKNMALCRGQKVLNQKDVAIGLILQFADSLNSDCLFIFDNNFFTSCNSHTEMVRKLQGTLEYANHYENYIMIFDLDSIAIPIYDVNGASSKAQVSSAASMKMLEKGLVYIKKYLRQELFYECLRIIQERQQINLNQNKWIISITQSVQVSIDFQERVNWPQSFKVKRYELQLEKKGIKRNCVRCGNLLSQIENEQNSDCRVHKEKEGLYIKQKPKRDEELDPSPQRIRRIYTVQEIKMMFKDKRIELNPEDIVWMCCRTSYSSKGCVQVRHQLEDIPIDQSMY